MTAIEWEPYISTADEVVILLRQRGLLDDTTSDGRFARRVAEALPEQRTATVRHYAYLVCVRNDDLLRKVGRAASDIPVEPEPPDYSIEAVQKALGVAARREARKDAAPEERPPPNCVMLDASREHLIVSFPFDRQKVDQIKLIPDREWVAQKRAWAIPIANWAHVEAFALEHGLSMAPRVREAFADAKAAGDSDEIYHLFIDEHHKTLIYRGGYVKEVVDHLRQIPGSKYRKDTKEWAFPAEQADKVDAIATSFGLRAHPLAAPILRQWSEEAEQMRSLSHAQDAEIEIPNFHVDLYDFQRAAVAYAQKAGFRTFIADQQGLGKSLEAIAACEVADKWPIIIACPSKVEVHWRREINRSVPHRKVLNLRGRKAREIEMADYVIVGWPNLAAWVEPLLAIGPQGIILDECHKAKNSRAMRTKAAKAITGIGTRELTKHDLEKMTGKPIPPDGPRLLLSGTFSLNDTAEIIPQLALIGRLEEFGGTKGMTERYVKIGHLSSEDQRTRRQELNNRLRSRAFIRRRKKDVLADLPEKTRSFLWIEGDPKVMVEYREAEDRLLEYLADRARKEALKLGLSLTQANMAAVMARMRASGAEHLVRINVLRQLAAKAKLSAALEWAQEFLDGTDESLLIYAHHRDIVNTMADRLHADRIMGGVNQKASQEKIDRFQAKEIRCLTLAILAAGEGITLTAASTGLFLELGWNPGTLTQSEDRMHRISQLNAVSVFYLLVENSIDADMIELLESKRQLVDDITDGADVENWNPILADDAAVAMMTKGSIAGDLIERLTRRALKMPGVQVDESTISELTLDSAPSPS